MDCKKFVELAKLDPISAMKRARRVKVIKRKTRTLIQFFGVDGTRADFQLTYTKKLSTDVWIHINQHADIIDYSK